jgi:hypothetical protein
VVSGGWTVETARLRVVPHRHRGQKPISVAEAKRRLRVSNLWDWSMRA